MKAKVVRRAEDWRWGSLWARRQGSAELKSLLSDWPVARPRNWVALVNKPLTASEAEAVATCMARNRPYGDEHLQKVQAKRLGLHTPFATKGGPKQSGAPRIL